MLPALSGTDQRLDALIDEIRGLRSDLAKAPAIPEPEENDQIELREPEPPAAKPRPKKT
jgi:hypothetical protein